MFLTGQPSLTFFKKVYRTHTKFATEFKRIELSRSDINMSTTTRMTCKLPRHADLVGSTYLVFEMPDLWVLRATSESRDASRVRWIQNLGEFAIDSYEVMVGSTRVDRQYGEWLHVWRELTLDVSQINMYNRMTGNVPGMYDPDRDTSRIYTEAQYAAGVAKPFVKGQKIYVPLGFWFSRNHGTALPLIALQYHDVYINFDFRPARQLYQVKLALETVQTVDGEYDEQYLPFLTPERTYMAPINIGNQHENIAHYLRSEGSSETSLQIKPYLEANYVYLDNAERAKFALSSLDYLMDQLMRTEKASVIGSDTLQLVLQNPVRELVVVARRPGASSNNEWSKMTRADGSALVQTMRLLLNGMERQEEKETSFYDTIQPFQHHTGSPHPGILVYSFALRPEEFQPTGSCNMSRINSVQLQVKVGERCDIAVYAVSHNFFRVAAGMGSIAFSL
jgi:hypothetical protein